MPYIWYINISKKLHTNAKTLKHDNPTKLKINKGKEQEAQPPCCNRFLFDTFSKKESEVR